MQTICKVTKHKAHTKCLYPRHYFLVIPMLYICIMATYWLLWATVKEQLESDLQGFFFSLQGQKQKQKEINIVWTSIIVTIDIIQFTAAHGAKT